MASLVASFPLPCRLKVTTARAQFTIFRMCLISVSRISDNAQTHRRAQLGHIWGLVSSSVIRDWHLYFTGAGLYSTAYSTTDGVVGALLRLERGSVHRTMALAFCSNLEERMNQLVSQIESGVNVDERSPLMEMVATNLKCGKSCGDRITRSRKPPHVREASVDGEDIDLDYGTMLFEEYLQAILLNHDGEAIEGLEEVCHTLAIDIIDV
ncbi:hypothetical protein HAX54_041895 [Datura stramonium]|uniref:Uncharacterized protein n=1 Tax=Datura stramonium TaxID=4076 RepID=A0ABS8VYN8_DATST|nr:hypothetical protein [Datura stramonium]